MEAYFLFRGSGRRETAAVCAEQEEDIGSPSDSEPSAPSTSGESASSELDDDASSSGSEDRFEMSDLVAQLPVKRGLSRFFDGRSQTFASLAAVGSLEDLAKPPRKRLKPSRSCGGGLDAHRGRVLAPRRHCNKATAAAAAAAAGARKAVLRTGALSVLAAAAPRRPTPLAAAPRPGGVAGNVLVVN